MTGPRVGGGKFEGSRPREKAAEPLQLTWRWTAGASGSWRWRTLSLHLRRGVSDAGRAVRMQGRARRAELGDLGSEAIHASWTAPSCDAAQPDHTKETCGAWPPGGVIIAAFAGWGRGKGGMWSLELCSTEPLLWGKGPPPWEEAGHLPALGLLGPVLGIAQQQGGLGLWVLSEAGWEAAAGGLCPGVLGRGQGRGRQGGDSPLEPLHSSTFPIL